jgi:uncharacterized membrane protein
MKSQNALKKIDEWYRVMSYLTIIFAIITFILYTVSNRGNHDISVPLFWASLVLTVFFLVNSVTIKKIYNYLTLIASGCENK